MRSGRERTRPPFALVRRSPRCSSGCEPPRLPSPTRRAPRHFTLAATAGDRRRRFGSAGSAPSAPQRGPDRGCDSVGTVVGRSSSGGHGGPPRAAPMGCSRTALRRSRPHLAGRARRSSAHPPCSLSVDSQGVVPARPAQRLRRHLRRPRRGLGQSCSRPTAVWPGAPMAWWTWRMSRPHRSAYPCSGLRAAKAGSN